MLESVRLFDEYQGDQVPAGKKSLAFSLRFRAPDRTLTADEIAAARDRCCRQRRSGCPTADVTAAHSIRRSTLPVSLRGSESATTTSRGRWYPARCSRANASTSADSVAGSASGAGTTKTHHPLAEVRVGSADRGDVGDLGAPPQHGLDLGRVHVLAAADDQVVGSAPDEQPSVRVEHPRSPVATRSPRRSLSSPSM